MFQSLFNEMDANQRLHTLLEKKHEHLLWVGGRAELMRKRLIRNDTHFNQPPPLHDGFRGFWHKEYKNTNTSKAGIAAIIK